MTTTQVAVLLLCGCFLMMFFDGGYLHNTLHMLLLCLLCLQCAHNAHPPSHS
jgi:hypothetical protein